MLNATKKPSASTNKHITFLREQEKMRAIAYSMDALIPGLYIWSPLIKIRIGGAVPDDSPYRYPGKIHSVTGIALVLPGYRILTTYQGTYDPRQAPD